MKRYFSFLLFIPLYVCCVWFVNYLQLVQYEVQEFEQYKLALSIDYAVDAATEEMLSMEHLGQDYSDKNKTVVDPDLALSVFVDVFALNYNLPLVEATKTAIKENYIQMFVVAAYDGFYVYEQQRVNAEGDYNLVGSMKIPYSYISEDGEYYYALNLGTTHALQVYRGYVTKVENPLSKEVTLQKINGRIGDELLYRLDASTLHGTDKTISFPASMTEMSKTRPIDSPTVMAFVSDLDITTAHTVPVFSIGGAHIEETRQVVGYVRSGTKYYCYADLLPTTMLSSVTEMFSSVQEAARAGYYYDATYME